MMGDDNAFDGVSGSDETFGEVPEEEALKNILDGVKNYLNPSSLPTPPEFRADVKKENFFFHLDRIPIKKTFSKKKKKKKDQAAQASRDWATLACYARRQPQVSGRVAGRRDGPRQDCADDRADLP